MFLLLVFVTIRAASAVTLNNAEAYYSFDNSTIVGNAIEDLAGNNNATNSGSTWTAGKLVDARSFDGANDKIESNNAFTWDGNGDWTWNFWIKYTTLEHSRSIINADATGRLIAFILNKDHTNSESTGRIMLYTYDTAAAYHSQTNNPALRDGNWHMITFVYDDTANTGQWYIDGSSVAGSGSVRGGDLWGNQKLRIGTNPASNLWFPGQLDELGFYERKLNSTEVSALWNGGAGYNPYTPVDDLDITEIHPYPRAQYNTNPAGPIYILANSTYNNWNCSLYINGTINQTQTLANGTNINCSFNVNLSVGTWNAKIRGETAIVDKNTSTTTIYFDNVAPVIASTTFVNNSLIYSGAGNLTANWNITDNFYLYRVTSWINGNLINNITEINATQYNYTINTNITGLTPGSHTLTIQVADGHTAQSITTDSYDWSNGILNDYLRFNFKQPYNPVNVRLENKDGSWLDSWKATPQKDRYTFSYEPWSIKSTYVINVISESKISILQHDGLNWLVFDNHWIDFEPYKVSYKRINPYEVQAIIQNPNLDSKLEFNSIGDLNIITRNYTFITTNLSVTYADPVNEAYPQTISLRIERNNTGITNTQAALYWNGTNISVTKYSCCPEAPGIYDLYTGTFATPLITSDPLEVFNFTWYYNVTHPLNNLTGNITLNQTVYRIGIDNCTTYTIRAVNITTRAENNNSLVNSDIAGYFEVWINQTSQYRAFNLTWTGNSTYGICINRNVTYRLNGQMEYEAPGYATKTYFLNNYALNNITSILNLYFTLNTTQVVLYVTDQNDDPVKNVYIHVQSYDIGTNSYKTTEIVKTDFEGRAFAQVILNTQWYQFMLAYNGVTVLQTDATKIVSTFLNFQINLEAATLQAWTKYNQISCGVTFNNITKNFRMDFNNPSSEPITALLTVYNSSRFSRKILGTNNITAASGTLLVNIGATTANNTFTGQGMITIDDQQFPCGTPASIGFNQDFQVWGLQGIFYAILIIIAITTAFIWGPEISVIATLVAIGGLWVFGIIGLSAPVIMTILILGGIIVYRLTRK